MPEEPEIAALVLAAGQARRFGADKRLALLEVEGRIEPLIVRALRSWVESAPPGAASAVT